MEVSDILMKNLAWKSHTTVGIMTVNVCSITVTQRLAVLSICRIYTLPDTVNPRSHAKSVIIHNVYCL